MANNPGWVDFFMASQGMSVDDAKVPKKQKGHGTDGNTVRKKGSEKKMPKKGMKNASEGEDAQSMTPFSRPAGGTVRGRKKAKGKSKSKD